MLLVVVMLSLAFGFVSYKFIDYSRLPDLIDPLAFLPFGAIVYLFQIMRTSTEIASLRLSTSERIRFGVTAERKKKIYTLAIAINILVGSASIMLYIVASDGEVFWFILFVGIYLTILSVVVCWIEQSYLSFIQRLIKERIAKRDEKSCLLGELSGNNHAPAG